jgi:hypothetical protein
MRKLQALVRRCRERALEKDNLDFVALYRSLKALHAPRRDFFLQREISWSRNVGLRLPPHLMASKKCHTGFEAVESPWMTSVGASQAQDD